MPHSPRSPTPPSPHPSAAELPFQVWRDDSYIAIRFDDGGVFKLSIEKAAEFAGSLPPPDRRKWMWLAAEDVELRRLYADKLAPRAIAKELGRSYRAVTTRLCVLQISSQGRARGIDTAAILKEIDAECER